MTLESISKLELEKEEEQISQSMRVVGLYCPALDP